VRVITVAVTLQSSLKDRTGASVDFQFSTGSPNGPVLFCSLASVVVVCQRRLSGSSVVVCKARSTTLLPVASTLLLVWTGLNARRCTRDSTVTSR